jgi:hypothetical protein
LTAYIQNNRTADFFGRELKDLINSLGFGKHVKFLFLLFFHTSDTLRKDIRQYDVITELQNPSNELIQIFSEELDLNEYWLDLMQQLSLLSRIALD